MNVNLSYVIHPNSRSVLGCSEIRVVHRTFSDYKKLLESRRDPSEIRTLLTNGEAKRNKMIWRALSQVTTHLSDGPGHSERVPDSMRSFMLNYFFINKTASQERFEADCHAKMKELIPDFDNRLSRKLLGSEGSPLSGRSGLIFSQVAPHIVGSSVLDIGAGDGKVGELVANQLGKSVRLVDVLDYNATSLPLDLYDGERLPYADKQFDTSIVSVVFHHADQPLKVLEETIRVTNQRIVVIESVYFNEEHRQLAVLLDWFYNRVLHKDVNCPFNFQTPNAWKGTFAHYNLKIAASTDLGIDQPLAPEYHWLYALDIPRALARGSRKQLPKEN